MNWTELLKAETAGAFKPTEGLFELVDADKLDWKPTDGKNWMTTGQLLKHLTDALGFCYRGFVTGDWRVPEGPDMGEMDPDAMLPPAEKLPTVDSLEQAKEMLAADKKMAYEMIEKAGEEDLASKMASAPWAPDFQTNLGHHMLQMVNHHHQHKAQLFYYLKLQGKDVNTMHMYGM